MQTFNSDVLIFWVSTIWPDQMRQKLSHTMSCKIEMSWCRQSLITLVCILMCPCNRASQIIFIWNTHRLKLHAGTNRLKSVAEVLTVVADYSWGEFSNILSPQFNVWRHGPALLDNSCLDSSIVMTLDLHGTYAYAINTK